MQNGRATSAALVCAWPGASSRLLRDSTACTAQAKPHKEQQVVVVVCSLERLRDDDESLPKPLGDSQSNAVRTDEGRRAAPDQAAAVVVAHNLSGCVVVPQLYCRTSCEPEIRKVLSLSSEKPGTRTSLCLDLMRRPHSRLRQAEGAHRSDFIGH